jgi:hypothetical protein
MSRRSGKDNNIETTISEDRGGEFYFKARCAYEHSDHAIKDMAPWKWNDMLLISFDAGHSDWKDSFQKYQWTQGREGHLTDVLSRDLPGRVDSKRVRTALIVDCPHYKAVPTEPGRDLNSSLPVIPLDVLKKLKKKWWQFNKKTFSFLGFQGYFFDGEAIRLLKEVVESNSQIQGITFGSLFVPDYHPSVSPEDKNVMSEINGILEKRRNQHDEDAQKEQERKFDKEVRMRHSEVQRGRDKEWEGLKEKNLRNIREAESRELMQGKSEVPTSWWERLKQAVRRFFRRDGALDSSIQEVGSKSQKVKAEQAQEQSQNEQKSSDEKTNDELAKLKQQVKEVAQRSKVLDEHVQTLAQNQQSLENNDSAVTRLESEVASLKESLEQIQESGVDIQEANLEQRKDVLKQREEVLTQLQEKLASIDELRSLMLGNTKEIQGSEDEKVDSQKNAKILANIEELQKHRNSVEQHLQIVQDLLAYEVDDNAKEKLEKIKSNENLHHFYMATKTALRAWVYQVYNGALKPNGSVPAEAEQILKRAASVNDDKMDESLVNIAENLPGGVAKIKAAVAVEASANMLGFIGKHVPVVGSAFQLVAYLLNNYNKIQKELCINRSQQFLAMLTNPELFIEQLARNLAVYQEATIERLSTNNQLPSAANSKFAEWMHSFADKMNAAKGKWQVTEAHKFAYWQVTQLLSSIFDNQLNNNERATQGELLKACLDQLLDQLVVSAPAPAAMVPGVSSTGITAILNSSTEVTRPEPTESPTETMVQNEHDVAQLKTRIEMLENAGARHEATLKRLERSQHHQPTPVTSTVPVGNGSQQQVQLELREQAQDSDVLSSQSSGNSDAREIAELKQMLTILLAEKALANERLQDLEDKGLEHEEGIRRVRAAMLRHNN